MRRAEQPTGGDEVRGVAPVPPSAGRSGNHPTGGDEACGAAPVPPGSNRIDSDPTGEDSAGGTPVVCPVEADRCGRLPDPRAAGRDAVPTAPAPACEALDDARSHLATIRDAITALRRVKLWTIGQRELLDMAREVETTLRSGYGVQVRLAGEMHERGVADMLGSRSAAYLLHESLNITVGDARARIAAATASLPTETPSGDTVPPATPHLLTAIDAGALSAGHAKVITSCLDKIPDAVDEETRAACRDTLFDQATLRDEAGLQRVAEQIGQIVDPDGSLSGKTPEERAELHIGASRRDGLTPIRGALSPLTAEQFRTAIEALSAPKPLDENTPDPRPAPLRREQALGEVLHRYLTAGAGPRDGGVRPQVVVTLGLGDLHGAGNDTGRGGGEGSRGGTAGRVTDWTIPDGWAPDGGWADPDPRTTGTGTGTSTTTGTRTDTSTGTGTRTGTDTSTGTGTRTATGASTGLGASGGYAWSDYDGVQSIALARLLACDAAIIPQVLGTGGAILAQGRAVRLFTAAQRRAITTRDRGCAFPGCDIPPAWCEAHHMIWWCHGGATDIANGILLCRRHHTLIHQGRWTIEHDPEGGRPWFIPPAHIDPSRQPRRNNHFHLPDLLTTVRRQ